MTYDQKLAERIRRSTVGTRGVIEKEMFGGVAWMLHGNMFVGIVKEDLMVRVGPEAHDDALSQPHARPMDFAGRPMKGYVYVAPPGVKTETALRDWLYRATMFAGTLPAKPTKGPAAPAKARAHKRRGGH